MHVAHTQSILSMPLTISKVWLRFTAASENSYDITATNMHVHVHVHVHCL